MQLRAVDEGAVGPTHEPEHGVLDSRARRRDRVARGVAQDEHVASCGRPRRRQQPLDVRVAAHHAVQHDDVGGLHPLWVDGDVDDAPLDAVAQARVGSKPEGVLVVRVHELEVRRARRSRAQQLELQLTDTSTDLQHRGAGDPARDEDVDDALLGAPEPLPPVPPRQHGARNGPRTSRRTRGRRSIRPPAEYGPGERRRARRPAGGRGTPALTSFEPPRHPPPSASSAVAGSRGSGGGRGIRTHDDVAAIAVFKTAALGHYASPPRPGRGPGEDKGMPSPAVARIARVGSEADERSHRWRS